MKFQWFGVSHFLITTDAGVRIATDPFQYNIIVDQKPKDANIIRPTYSGEADVVTISHSHGDHSYIWAIQGVPLVYTGGAPEEFKGVKFSSVASYHGMYLGLNNIIIIEADDLRICHVGDHGHVLNDKQIEEIGRVDILMTNWDDDPMEMTFEVLDVVLNQLKPKVVFPMHHVIVNEFMTGRKGFVDLTVDNVTEVEFTAESLPSEMQVVLFKPSLGNPVNYCDEEQPGGIYEPKNL